ncbi:response regulator [Priestia aryabhattai]|uniref:response regulator n=1 Tax=Priestia aryabhattai TaxID=412384 RepID=UPI003D284A6D
MKIKVLLVDDHALFLHGLKQLLEVEEDIQIVDTLSDPLHLFFCIRQTSPDIVVIDIRIKSFNGIELTKQIIKDFPDIKVVVLSGYNYDEYIEAAFQAGANAFITKERSNVELVSTIRQSYQGYKVFPRTAAGNPYSCTDLTKKEREVLKLIAQDKTNIEISGELIISKRTVERHISSILRKLDADSRVGAVVNGIKKGVLTI